MYESQICRQRSDLTDFTSLSKLWLLEILFQSIDQLTGTCTSVCQTTSSTPRLSRTELDFQSWAVFPSDSLNTLTYQLKEFKRSSLPQLGSTMVDMQLNHCQPTNPTSQPRLCRNMYTHHRKNQQRTGKYNTNTPHQSMTAAALVNCSDQSLWLCTPWRSRLILVTQFHQGSLTQKYSPRQYIL